MRHFILLLFLSLSLHATPSFQEATSLFQQKKYTSALTLFESPETLQEKPFGALLGQLFCHVTLNSLDHVDSTLLAINKKIESIPDCATRNPQTPETLEEHRAAYACRNRVREVSNEMRQTVEQLVRETVPGFFQKIKMLRKLYPFIDSLERVALDCCQGHQTASCCLNPLFEQLEVWNSLGLQEES